LNLDFAADVLMQMTTRPEACQRSRPREIVDRLVVPEQRQQKDDWQRNADQPEQQAFTKGHDLSPSLEDRRANRTAGKKFHFSAIHQPER
jgi:hypothetical protein